MKKVITGLGFCALGMGTILTIISCAAPYADNLMVYTMDSKVWDVVTDFGLMPLVILGGIFLFLGVATLIWGLFEK